MNPSANWIELNDACTSDKVWVSMSMVTAIEVSVGHTRMRFDKDNYITVTQKPQQVFVLAGIGVVKRPPALMASGTSHRRLARMLWVRRVPGLAQGQDASLA